MKSILLRIIYVIFILHSLPSFALGVKNKTLPNAITCQNYCTQQLCDMMQSYNPETLNCICMDCH